MTAEMGKAVMRVGNVPQYLQKYYDMERVDLVITSPPYNKSSIATAGAFPGPIEYDKYTDDIPEARYQEWQCQVLEELYHIVKPGGSLFYNHKVRHHQGSIIHPMEWIRDTSWKVRQEIVWDRILAMQLRGWYYWQIDERIYWLYKPKADGKRDELESRHSKLMSVWRERPEQKSGHPAPFPLWLPTRIAYSILGSTNEGAECKTILDPFVGSGTTGVAARLLGHHFVGIDISEQYISEASKRIDNAESERPEFEKEIAKHVAGSTKTRVYKKKGDLLL